MKLHITDPPCSPP